MAGPPHWQRWDEAAEALFALGDERPAPVIIDDFLELVGHSPALPSVLHGAYLRVRRERPDNRLRLILSGASPAVIRRLFAGPSSLHGVASLELAVPPFGFRKAARFWGIRAPRLAVQVHAVVGGTPAYRGDLVCDDVPAGPDDFDSWVCRTVLNPRVPLFWEARHLLEQEGDYADRALCHSVLVAIAGGRSTPGGIADRLGASLHDVSHVLAVMHKHGLLHAEPDAFRPGLTRYRIAEPLLAFEHAIAWPHRAALEQEEPATVWHRIRPEFDAAVAAPHFAQLCRDWATQCAAWDTFGGEVSTAVRGTVPDPEGDARLDAEVVVRGIADGRQGAAVGRAGPLRRVMDARTWSGCAGSWHSSPRPVRTPVRPCRPATAASASARSCVRRRPRARSCWSARTACTTASDHRDLTRRQATGGPSSRGGAPAVPSMEGAEAFCCRTGR
ncbi:ATP-binding protein [Streptomyces albulus]|nr:ATP-binding protein [Streptomyces noursei]